MLQPHGMRPTSLEGQVPIFREMVVTIDETKRWSSLEDVFQTIGMLDLPFLIATVAEHDVSKKK